jgi:hypothetical protein
VGRDFEYGRRAWCRVFLPEIHRLRAECLLRFDPPNFDEALREFEVAIAAAKQQQSRAFELQAAMGLAPCLGRAGGRPKGRGANRCAKLLAL